jgi:hypothetical protein
LYKGGANRRTPSSFNDATTTYLTADSARLEVPVKDYRKDFFEFNLLLAEFEELIRYCKGHSAWKTDSSSRG